MTPVTPVLRIVSDFQERHRLELFVKDPRLAGVFKDGEVSWEIPLGRALLWMMTLVNFLQIKHREKDLL